MISAAGVCHSTQKYTSNFEEGLVMAENIIPKANYFLVGLGAGSVAGILFAPKSGEETGV
jgi:hypothetical protein